MCKLGFQEESQALLPMHHSSGYTLKLKYFLTRGLPLPCRTAKLGSQHECQRHEIKPLSSQNHIEPHLFVTGAHHLSLLALHSKTWVALWTMSSFCLCVGQRAFHSATFLGNSGLSKSWQLNTFKLWVETAPAV